MVGQECAPGLRWWSVWLDPVLGHGCLADFDTELQQLSVDAWRTPKWVGHRHLSDQLSCHSRHPRSSRPSIPALPSPVVPEPAAMPANHGLGLDYVEGSAPVGPEATEDVPEGPISPEKGRSGRIALEDFDLVAQGGVLEDQGLA